MPLKTILALLLVLSFTAVAKDKKANTLSSAEKRAGWKLLFDGKTLNGWRGFHSDSPPTGWIVEDGCISRPANADNTPQFKGDLITTDEYQNFELSLEWKVVKGGNSGLKYLVSETLPPTGRSAISFEMQILDDDNHPDAKAGINGNRKSSALYDLMPTNNRKKLRPVGEFNEIRLIVMGKHIEHWLNGVKVLEFERDSDALRALIAQSKFKNTVGFGTFSKGHLLLQEHGDRVWFRNIKIRELK